MMIPARLFRMGPAEIAGRSVQELRKRLDRRGLDARPDPVLGVLDALAPDAGARRRSARGCAPTISTARAPCSSSDSSRRRRRDSSRVR